MKKNNLTKGFTLIELLVVVAIIGILASVVLASLNSARNKGADAAIKSSLANARAQAELFYDTPQSYNGVCALTGTSVIGAMVRSAEAAYDGGASTYADATASTWDNAQCHDTNQGWVAWVPLKASSATSVLAWCADATGASRQVTVVLPAGGVFPTGYVCP